MSSRALRRLKGEQRAQAVLQEHNLIKEDDKDEEEQMKITEQTTHKQRNFSSLFELPLAKMADCYSQNADSDAHERPECKCDPVFDCQMRSIVDDMFKQHYRDHMVFLLEKIINDACDSNHDCTGDGKRVKNLKREMDIVRGALNSWADTMNQLTHLCVRSNDAVCATITKILEVLTGWSDEMGVTQVLCMSTYITDICVSLLSQNKIANITEIVEVMANHILEHDRMLLEEFLCWLDIQ
ncbi:uncharacterized protein LOC130220022 [Danio aesculapii]|uniref:uncharacterized protein LOC130220022 n=1 Tax=Danio aesculapii TaxID=1142201 RepID=UPI0024C05DCA|nr:uncharacterized protein LOC130220022 [Danio aesculapii]